MKILQVTPFFYPAWSYGGPAKLVYELSCYLSKHCCEVTVYTTDAFSRNERMPSKNRIDRKSGLIVCYFQNLSNFLAYHFKLFLPFGLLKKLFTDLRKFDAIHIHDFFNLLTISISLFAIIYRRSYVISVHGQFGKIALRHRYLIKKIFLFFFGTWILKHAKYVIAHSLQEIDDYQNIGLAKSKIVYLPTGINCQDFFHLPPRGLFRKKHHLNQNTRILLYLGRIHQLKGLDLLLEAFAKIANPQLKLVIAGSDDGYLCFLKKKIVELDLEGKVLILGITTGKEKLELYVDSDIFILPSRVLACPLTFMTNLEVMAAGLPLVTTGNCKNCDLISYHAGKLVAPSVAGLVSGIKFFLSNDRLRKSYGANARNLIFKKFNWRKNVIYFKKFYKKLINLH